MSGRVYQEFLLRESDLKIIEHSASHLERAVSALTSEGFHVLIGGDSAGELPTKIIVGRDVDNVLPIIKARVYTLLEENGKLPYRSGDWYLSK